jgi:hypothetical protein
MIERKKPEKDKIILEKNIAIGKKGIKANTGHTWLEHIIKMRQLVTAGMQNRWAFECQQENDANGHWRQKIHTRSN